LTPTEEHRCLVLSKAGDKEARDLLIESNLRLVAHIVKKYNSPDCDTEELISIGTIGLMKAIDTYDMEKGRKLATYASRCVENELLMFFRQKKKRNKEVSLFDPIGVDKEGNEISLLDIIESEEKDMIEEMDLADNSKVLYALVGEVLNNREKQVICQRYGIGGIKEITQRQIGEQMGISRSYVSRIEKKALEKLRQGFEKKRE
jgi:RNA polymerase sporulation-specific sigma factor